MNDEPQTILQRRVQERLDALEKKPAPLAKSLGYSDSFIRDILRKGTTPSAARLAKLAAALETTPEYLLGETDQLHPEGERTVPIVGYAGAGPEGSVLFAEGQGNYGEAAAPLDAAETAEALEVRGDSMHGLANDGWLIFYEDKSPPGPEHLGEPCVCWLATGRVLVKTPQLGSSKGLYHLESVNAPTMRDVAVEAMAVITDIKTRAAAKRYIRRHPDVQFEDLVVERA